MLEICPYYFDLKEKIFGMSWNKTLRYNRWVIWWCGVNNFCADNHLDNIDAGINSNSSVGTEEDNQKQSSDSTRRISDTPKSAGKKKQKSLKKRHTGKCPPELDRFNALLMTNAKRKSAEMAANNDNNNSGGKVRKMVSLMSKWKSADKSIGCPIKAAYSCPEFE